MYWKHTYFVVFVAVQIVLQPTPKNPLILDTCHKTCEDIAPLKTGTCHICSEKILVFFSDLPHIVKKFYTLRSPPKLWPLTLTCCSIQCTPQCISFYLCNIWFSRFYFAHPLMQIKVVLCVQSNIIVQTASKTQGHTHVLQNVSNHISWKKFHWVDKLWFLIDYAPVEYTCGFRYITTGRVQC